MRFCWHYGYSCSAPKIVAELYKTGPLWLLWVSFFIPGQQSSKVHLLLHQSINHTGFALSFVSVFVQLSCLVEAKMRVWVLLADW